MPVITVNSAIGGGAIPVGRMVAERLRLNFVDRLIFTQAARLVGSPVGALIDKEQRVVRFRDRLGNFIQTMLERSAVAGVSGEPYFGRGIETLPPETYMELAGETATAQKVDDEAFMEATRTVVMDLYRKGDVVIVGRGANVILGDTPDVIHVGLLAPLETQCGKDDEPGAFRPRRVPKLRRRTGPGQDRLLPQILQCSPGGPQPLPRHAEHGQGRI